MVLIYILGAFVLGGLLGRQTVDSLAAYDDGYALGYDTAMSVYKPAEKAVSVTVKSVKPEVAKEEAPLKEKPAAKKAKTPTKKATKTGKTVK